MILVLFTGELMPRIFQLTNFNAVVIGFVYRSDTAVFIQILLLHTIYTYNTNRSDLTLRSWQENRQEKGLRVNKKTLKHIRTLCGKRKEHNGTLVPSKGLMSVPPYNGFTVISLWSQGWNWSRSQLTLAHQSIIGQSVSQAHIHTDGQFRVKFNIFSVFLNTVKRKMSKL